MPNFGGWLTPSSDTINFPGNPGGLCDPCDGSIPDSTTLGGCVIKVRINGILLGQGDVFCCDNSVHPNGSPINCVANFCGQIEVDLCNKKIKIRKPDACP